MKPVKRIRPQWGDRVYPGATGQINGRISRGGVRKRPADIRVSIHLPPSICQISGAGRHVSQGAELAGNSGDKDAHELPRRIEGDDLGGGASVAWNLRKQSDKRL